MGGRGCDSGKVTINGGTVIANGGNFDAGIGRAFLYFAPSAAKSFCGYAGCAEISR